MDSEFTNDEISTLLYLETRAVDYGGVVNTLHMNSNDISIANNWNRTGFIGFGRIIFKDHKESGRSGRGGTHWVELSNEAWMAVSRLRRERADRFLSNRDYMRTCEK